jgi:Beta-fructosidases (levanase/invertase)
VVVDGDRVLMLAWMGLPAQDDHPTVEAEGWVHCLTVPRRLRLIDHVLHQELVVPEGAGQRYTLGSEPVRIDLRSDTFVDWDGHRIAVERAGDRRVATCRPGKLVVADDVTAIEIIAGDGSIAFSLRVFSDMG